MIAMDRGEIKLKILLMRERRIVQADFVALRCVFQFHPLKKHFYTISTNSYSCSIFIRSFKMHCTV